MWYTVVFLLAFTCANGLLVETLYPPIRPSCGCGIIESCGILPRCGYSAIDYVNDCVVDGYPTFMPDYIYPINAVDMISPVCDCSLDRYDLVCPRTTIPPLPPVIGCPKYLRQITIPPPFL